MEKNKPVLEKLLTAIGEFKKTNGKEPRLIRVTLEDFVSLQHEGAWSPSETPHINKIPAEWSPNLSGGKISLVL
jgi:hypothetical protein